MRLYTNVDSFINESKKHNDITTGFEFKYDGVEVIVKTDYQKHDKTMDFVQIVAKNNPKKSMGQLSKSDILDIVNKK